MKTTIRNNITSINRSLSFAVGELAKLTALLTVSEVPTPVPIKHGRGRPMGSKNRAKTGLPINRLVNRIVKVTRNPNRVKTTRLTPENKADIMILLNNTDIPVVEIAKLYHVSRPSIYNLRDKMGLGTHRGSEALIAGVKRSQETKTPPKVEESASPVLVTS